MSTTKIVIIVLVLIGLLFVIFVARGALRSEPAPPKGKDLTTSSKKTKPPNWTQTIKGLFKSIQPRLELPRDTYSANKEDNVAPNEKKPFRTATFHLISGRAEISYFDFTPKSNTPLKDMDNPQPCRLPQEDPDVSDKERCSILALKDGGKLTFTCRDNKPCEVKVE